MVSRKAEPKARVKEVRTVANMSATLYTTYMIRFVLQICRVFLSDCSRLNSTDTLLCTGAISILGKTQLIMSTGIISHLHLQMFLIIWDCIHIHFGTRNNLLTSIQDKEKPTKDMQHIWHNMHNNNTRQSTTIATITWNTCCKQV